MIKFLRKVRARVHQARNLRLLDDCGSGTILSGQIEKRDPSGRIQIGEGCLIQGHLVTECSDSVLIVGDRVSVGGGTVIDCALSVIIESDVMISYGCTVVDADNHSIYPELRRNDVENWINGKDHDWSLPKKEAVRVCEGAWIGARSIILKGVTIGSGSVVGMGSVVTKDVPERVIVAGNPAMVVGHISKQ